MAPTQSPIHQAIMADPSTVKGAVVQGFRSGGPDPSFFITSPTYVKVDPDITWQYANVGVGYTLQLSGTGVLNPTVPAGFYDFGTNGSKISAFNLFKTS